MDLFLSYLIAISLVWTIIFSYHLSASTFT